MQKLEIATSKFLTAASELAYKYACQVDWGTDDRYARGTIASQQKQVRLVQNVSRTNAQRDGMVSENEQPRHIERKTAAAESSPGSEKQHF